MPGDVHSGMSTQWYVDGQLVGSRCVGHCGGHGNAFGYSSGLGQRDGRGRVWWDVGCGVHEVEQKKWEGGRWQRPNWRDPNKQIGNCRSMQKRNLTCQSNPNFLSSLNIPLWHPSWRHQLAADGNESWMKGSGM